MVAMLIILESLSHWNLWLLVTWWTWRREWIIYGRKAWGQSSVWWECLASVLHLDLVIPLLYHPDYQSNAYFIQMSETDPALNIQWLVYLCTCDWCCFYCWSNDACVLVQVFGWESNGLEMLKKALLSWEIAKVFNTLLIHMQVSNIHKF